MVRLGFLENGRPVAVKTIFTTNLSEQSLLKDIQGTIFAHRLNRGPAFHGGYTQKFKDFDGQERLHWNLVMDVQPGEFALGARHFITIDTLEDFHALHNELKAAGTGMQGDFQYYIAPEGRIQLIDSGSLMDPRLSDEKERKLYLFEFSELLMWAPLEVALEEVERLKADRPAVYADLRETALQEGAPWQGFRSWMAAHVDKAILTKDKSQLGGIDLTPAHMNLQTQNAGGGIKFHLDPVLLRQLQNAPGFVPVIINIQPMVDLGQFLGVDALDSR